jgi:hypothetical protein
MPLSGCTPLGVFLTVDADLRLEGAGIGEQEQKILRDEHGPHSSQAHKHPSPFEQDGHSGRHVDQGRNRSGSMTRKS